MDRNGAERNWPAGNGIRSLELTRNGQAESSGKEGFDHRGRTFRPCRGENSCGHRIWCYRSRSEGTDRRAHLDGSFPRRACGPGRILDTRCFCQPGPALGPLRGRSAGRVAQEPFLAVPPRQSHAARSPWGPQRCPAAPAGGPFSGRLAADQTPVRNFSAI